MIDYRISSNKGPGDYLFPKLLGAALIKGQCSFRSKGEESHLISKLC